MSDEKTTYQCPECGGQLQVWEEHVRVYSQKINPRTGAIAKKVHKDEPVTNGLNGICCTQCSWEDYEGVIALPEYNKE